MHKPLKVTIKPEGIDVYVLPGTSILEAAARLGIIINSACGGKGICKKCKVEIIKGKERQARLACQARIDSPLIVHIPPEVRLSAQKILVLGVEKKREIKPSVWKTYMELDPPTLKDQRADLELIRKKIPKFSADIYILRKIPQSLRENDYKITCVFSHGELISIEKGDTTGKNYGLAFDLGTTTLVASLLDLHSGEDLGITVDMNPQAAYGDDVISRINFVRENSRGLEALQQKLIGTINEMIERLVKKAGIKRENIYKMIGAGNTFMQHIFLKITPENLGVIPFAPVIKEGIEVKAKKLGIEINPDGVAYVFPVIGGFVGGDTVSLILASQLYRAKKTKIAVDIGTNGEIVIGNRDRLICASTAAGPAFEGARISQGMRACEGAIEKVMINKDVQINVIGNVRPRGICGSGLVDAVAQMLEKGIISSQGKMLSAREKKDLPPALSSRIMETEEGNKFLLAGKKDGADAVFITQRDIRELQLAKAAIYAGIQILLQELELRITDIDEILLAGAFGNFIRRKKAVRIGLLPQFPLEKIKYIGNAASSGAKLALLSEDMCQKAQEISHKARYVELSTRKNFQDEFAQAIFFPEGGIEK